MQVHLRRLRRAILHDVMQIREIDPARGEVRAHEHGEPPVEELVERDAAVRRLAVKRHRFDASIGEKRDDRVRLRRGAHEHHSLVLLLPLERAHERLRALVVAANLPDALLQLRVDASELFGADPSQRIDASRERVEDGPLLAHRRGGEAELHARAEAVHAVALVRDVDHLGHLLLESAAEHLVRLVDDDVANSAGEDPPVAHHRQQTRGGRHENLRAAKLGDDLLIALDLRSLGARLDGESLRGASFDLVGRSAARDVRGVLPSRLRLFLG